MYITELEIDNFKSFGKKTKIPFFEGFTVISGPNGSGKSNIIDSILFCLALSSARGLRAEKLTDLINLNSGKNTAEVAITFSEGTKIRRKVKRTAHGYYSYNYIDDRLCKQGDVVELLAKAGIKPEGYNVVMQGDVTRITEMTDFERRKIIDEIAGVAEFDKKKGQAIGELEVVRERIEREELLLRELTYRMEELKNEREQAIKYRDLQEKLQYFKGCQSAAKLNERERELLALRQLISGQQSEIGRIEEERHGEEDKISDLNRQIAEIDAKINEKSGAEYLRLLSSLEAAKGEIKVSEQTIARLKEEKESGLESVKRIYMDSKRAETRVGECTDSIRNLSIDRSNLGMEVASRRAEMEVVETELSGENNELEGAKEQLFSLINEQEGQKEKRSELLRQQDILIEKSRMRSSEKERLDARIARIDEELNEKSQQCEEYKSFISRLGEEKQILEKSLSRTESNVFSYRKSLEKVKNEIRSHERELMKLEAQQQAGGGPGGKALEAILGMDGIYGTVAQLGRAPPEYATALDIAAGGRLKNVVVENDSVAASAIRYLKENRLGRVTFLPLNKLRAPRLEPLNDSSVIDYAVNLLDYDPLFDTVFRQIFGSTVVIDGMDRARRMMGKYRMVTLDGDLLERGGAMTGGSQKKKVSGFGIAVDDEINSLRHLIAGLEAESVELEQAVARYAKESDELRKQRMGLEEQIARYEMLDVEYSKRLSALSEELHGILESKKSMQDDVKGGAENLQKLEEDLEIISGNVRKIGEEIDTLKSRLDDTNIPALTEKLDRFRREIAETERRLRNKDADIADMQRERQHFSRRLEEFTQQREAITLKNQQIDEEIVVSRQNIEDSKALIEDLEVRQQSFSRELGELQGARDALMDSLRVIEKRLVELDGANERLRLQIDTLDEREKSVVAEIEELKSEVGDSTTDLTLKEIEEGINGAERSLKKIGAVNMLAIEEYDRVEKRISDRTEKKDTLSSERTNLIERIEHFEKMKFDSFMDAYNVINSNFKKIFARLTSGSGRLVLDNEDDPFSGGMTFAVQPRDKKVHLLSALSGGEKSLTTLSFIFSIQQFMPAPFYALDEVDMMLDASNVERISTLIQELSAKTQSICVSLRKPTIERADRIIGVTTRPDKSTYVTGVKNNA